MSEKFSAREEEKKRKNRQGMPTKKCKRAEDK